MQLPDFAWWQWAAIAGAAALVAVPRLGPAAAWLWGLVRGPAQTEETTIDEVLAGYAIVLPFVADDTKKALQHDLGVAIWAGFDPGGDTEPERSES